AVRPLTIGLALTLRTNMEKIAERFGAVLLDEAHHTAASSVIDVLAELPARYRFGTTATAQRADGRWHVVQEHLGRVVAAVKVEDVAADGFVVRPEYRTVHTSFRFSYTGPSDWPELLAAIVEDEERNRLIVDTVVKECRGGAAGLVLTGRVNHAHLLAGLLR